MRGRRRTLGWALAIGLVGCAEDDAHVDAHVNADAQADAKADAQADVDDAGAMCAVVVNRALDCPVGCRGATAVSRLDDARRCVRSAGILCGEWPGCGDADPACLVRTIDGVRLRLAGACRDVPGFRACDAVESASFASAPPCP